MTKGSSDLGLRVKVAAGIALAIILRLIFMPISLHGDLFYVHSMPPVLINMVGKKT